MTITSFMNEKKLLGKLYQKLVHRQYVTEVDAAIKISLNDNYRNLMQEEQELTYENLLSLQDRIGYVKVGLSEEEIQRIGISTLDQPDTCSICLGQGDYGKVLVCNHFFHTECIDQWLKEKRSCPLCLSEAVIR